MIKANWKFEEVKALFDLSFTDLIYQAQTTHRKNFDPNIIQFHTLCSAKTGGCLEDCAYCPQSVHYATGIKKQNLLSPEDVIKSAKKAKQNGADRFSIAIQGKNPDKKDFAQIVLMVKEVKKLGLAVCATLGELSDKQIEQLEEAGLDSYNHNIDTSPEFYNNIITTHGFDGRVATLKKLAKSNINICCGGIIGMGESQNDRINFLIQLANLPKQPAIIPLNMLIKIKGTPLENAEDVDPFDFVRVIAITRIMFPQSLVGLAAGRKEMSDEMQALCFLAGANVIHCGEKLLVTPLPGENKDKQLLQKLGISVGELAE